MCDEVIAHMYKESTTLTSSRFGQPPQLNTPATLAYD